MTWYIFDQNNSINYNKVDRTLVPINPKQISLIRDMVSTIIEFVACVFDFRADIRCQEIAFLNLILKKTKYFGIIFLKYQDFFDLLMWCKLYYFFLLRPYMKANNKTFLLVLKCISMKLYQASKTYTLNDINLKLTYVI